METSRARRLGRRSQGRTLGTTTEKGNFPRPKAAHMRPLRRAHVATAIWERSGAVWCCVEENGVRHPGT